MNPKIIFALSSVPFFGYILLFIYAMIAFFSVGHWPSYGNPDPKELELPIIHTIVGIGMLGSLLAILITPFLLGFSILNWRKKSKEEKKSFKRSAILFTMGTLIWITDFSILHSDGPSLINWFLD